MSAAPAPATATVEAESDLVGAVDYTLFLELAKAAQTDLEAAKFLANGIAAAAEFLRVGRVGSLAEYLALKPLDRAFLAIAAGGQP